MACGDDRRAPGRLIESNIVDQPESAVGHCGHFVDQTGKDGVGLVVGHLCRRRRFQARNEYRHDEALHRLFGGSRFRVHAASMAAGRSAAPAPTDTGATLPAPARISTCQRFWRYAKSKNVKHLAMGALDRHQPPDGRGFPSIRKVGHRGREDRFHGSRRPVDGRLLSPRR